MIALQCRTESNTMPIPLGFRAIADDLRARIQGGEYPPGQVMPSYRELAEMYSVGVTTMQRAVLILQTEGWIVGVQGRGLYVPEELPR